MTIDNRSSLIDVFLSQKFSEYTRSSITGDASFRSYERVHSNGQSYILMDAPPETEDVKPFIFMAEFLKNNSLSAPSVILRDVENGFLLLEDLGDVSYNKALKGGRCDESDLYKDAVDVLIKIHSIPLPPELVQHNSRAMDEVLRLTDWYLPYVAKLERNDVAEKEFREIWNQLINDMGDGSVVCLYDYHADNLMWMPERDSIERVGLLDFQDAVIGSQMLDLAALLQDIRRDVTPEIKEEMLSYYIEQSGKDYDSLIAEYRIWGAHWNTRILGTFARLAYQHHKMQYLDYLPTVWNRLEENLDHPNLADLKKWFEKHLPEGNRYG